MRPDSIKLELIEWLTKLNDVDFLNYLKIVKDSRSESQDWWDDLTEEQKLGIQRGLKDIDENRITSHNEVKKRYGL